MNALKHRPGRPWTPASLNTLRKYAEISHEDMAKILKRTKGGVSKKRRKLGLS